MTNYKTFRKPDIKLSNDSSVLEVTVYYSKGGINYFNGQRTGSGYYLGITPIQRRKDGGYSMMLLTGKQGFKTLLEAADRYNENRLQKHFETLEANPLYTTLLNAVCEKNNFIIATSPEEAFKPIELAIGQKVTTIPGDMVGFVIERTGDDYKIAYDDFTTRVLKTYTTVDDQETICQPVEPAVILPFDTVNVLKLEIQKRINAAKEAEDEKKREFQRKQDAHLTELKTLYPQATQEGSDHARGAKNLKRELQILWPATQFNVTSSYSSIDVRWTDGATTDEVNKIAEKYSTSTWNSYEDLTEYKKTPEAVANLIWLGGTQYVSCVREYTEATRAKFVAEYGDHWRRHWSETNLYDDSNYTPEPEPTDNGEVIVRKNAEHHGIEIVFKNKPDYATLEKVKSNGFRWSKFKKLWYARETPRRLDFAYSLATGTGTTNTGIDYQLANFVADALGEERMYQ